MTPRAYGIGLVARDLPTTLAFYRRLGLGIPADADSEPHVEVELPGGLRLLFDQASTIAAFDPSFDPAADLGGTTLAFSCDDPTAVDRAHADLVDAGYASHLDPFDAFWGQRYAVVADPDGNHVDLFAALSGDSAP